MRKLNVNNLDVTVNDSLLVALNILNAVVSPCVIFPLCD